MARFNTSGLDDIISEMERMGEAAGDIAEEMVTAAGEEIREAWRRSAEKHGLRDTGEMIESISAGPVTRAGAILYRDIYPQGKDSKGVRNAEKAFILHYGKHGYPATYWVDDADRESEAPVESRIQEIWNRHNGG